MNATSAGPTDTLAAIRRFVAAIFVVGVIGTAGELLLVGHTHGFWQWIPLGLIAVSLAVLGWLALGPSTARVRVFQATMILFILGGALGLFLHYDGKVEFKLESNPSLAGWALFKEAMAGAMPPAIAPAAMIHLGLLGLAYTYRYPAQRRQVTVANRTLS